MAFKNVLFQSGEAVLSAASFPELDIIASYMKVDPKMYIEIYGHTDNAGDENKNLELSKKRAAAVGDYLIAKGVNIANVSSSGYGSAKPLGTNETAEGRKQNRRVEIFIYFSFITILLLGIITILIFRNNSIIKKNQELTSNYKILESKINAVELDGIKYKMNPHLFKNILNSIQSHAYQTYFSLDKLSNVLDYILYETDKKFVTVKEELEFSLNLIEINKLKLSPLFDLQIKNKIDEHNPLFHQELLAPMVTIDLIENAFKHADTQSGDSFISITFELKDDFFALTVANKISSKPSLKKTNSGVGRENTKKRLDIIYKECYQLDQFEENEIFISHLKINLLEYKAKMPAVR
jgi:hypothetical protein